MTTESSLSGDILSIHIYLRNANTDNSLQANYRCSLAELILQQKAILDTARGKLAFTGSIKHKYLFAERKTPIFRRNLLR